MYFLSFNGGLRSHLALYQGLKEGDDVKCLFTIETEEGRIPAYLLEASGACLGIPVKISDVFLKGIEELKEEGFTGGIVYQGWQMEALEKVAFKVHEPLKDMDGETVARAFINQGFKGMVTSVNKERASMKYMGRFLDENTMEEMISEGVDPSGGAGEFQLLVVDGPTFTKPLEVVPIKIYQDDKIGYIEYEEK